VSVQINVLPPRYRDPQLVARGGMGEIYRAIDDTLGRTVAVKVLAARYSENEDIRKRFTREALAAARLSGEPNTITIYDVGEWEGRPFIVMEHLGGGSLEDVLSEQGRQEPGQTLAWLEQAGVALDRAHARGVVHRDVKPRRRAPCSARLATSRPSRPRASRRRRPRTAMRSASSASSS